MGQAITLRVGDDVVLLSFFSASAGNADPITQADATEVTLAQGKALGDRLRIDGARHQHAPVGKRWARWCSG